MAEDEKLHKKFHTEKTAPITYNTRKAETVVEELDDGKIICIESTEKYFSQAKMTKLRERIDTSLCIESEATDDYKKLYLFIKGRKIAGAIEVEPASEAFPIISDKSEPQKPDIEDTPKQAKDIISFLKPVKAKRTTLDRVNVDTNISCNTQEAKSVKMGIEKIWVEPKYRRQGIATKLVNAARTDFLDGNIDLKETALSQPTAAGILFADKYYGKDNWLIYF